MKWFFIIGIFITFFSCENGVELDYYENTCNIENPVENLPWLREMIASLEKSDNNFYFIEQCEFDGKTHFILNNCLNNTSILAYDCDGKEICALTRETNCAVVTEKRIVKLIIWQSEYSECR